MKNFYKTIIAGCLLTGSVAALQAQALHTGYFSDSYLYRHQLNPALSNSCSYVSIPVLGNVNLGFNSNIGVKNFIYEKKDGSGLTTFMNDEISAGAFVKDLNPTNTMKLNLDMTVFSLGLKLGGGYYTLDINEHVRTKMDLDKDLFRFMKEMSNNTHYDLGNTRATGMAWTEVALGHSRDVLDFVRIGAKVKLLLGNAYADANFDRTYAELDEEVWRMRMNADLAVAGGGKYKTKEGTTEVSGYEDFQPGINGKGFAVDLGASFTLPLVEHLKISASLTDIGAIKWDCEKAKSDGEEFTFEGFNNTKIHPDEGTIDPETGKSGYTDGTMDEQWKRIEDDLEDMSKMYVQAPAKVRERLGATANLGVEFELPIYNKISFGALYSQRFSDKWNYAEGRIVANYAPSHAFDLALSACFGSNGGGFGALANLHVPGFNIFVGVDQFYLGSFNSNMIPLEDGGLSVNMGINVPLGY